MLINVSSCTDTVIVRWREGGQHTCSLVLFCLLVCSAGKIHWTPLLFALPLVLIMMYSLFYKWKWNIEYPLLFRFDTQPIVAVVYPTKYKTHVYKCFHLPLRIVLIEKRPNVGGSVFRPLWPILVQTLMVPGRSRTTMSETSRQSFSRLAL